MLYVGLIQVACGQVYPALPASGRAAFVALFPLLLSAMQRLARKVLSRLPALRSRDEFGAGRWPKHCVAALASVFFAFGETLNLAVLVAGTETSVRAVALNLALRLTTGVSARVCAMWRLRRWLSRRFGRKLSYNPRKLCRRLPPDGLPPKTRNRVSAIFLGNRSFAGYATPLLHRSRSRARAPPRAPPQPQS